MGKILFAGNLADGFGGNRLQALFERYGAVNHVTRVTCVEDPAIPDFGFVTMPDRAEAETARKNLHGAVIDRRAIIVTAVRQAGSSRPDAVPPIIFEPPRRFEPIDDAGSSSAMVFPQSEPDSGSVEAFVGILRDHLRQRSPQSGVSSIVIACSFCRRSALETEQLAVGPLANICGGCLARCARKLN